MKDEDRTRVAVIEDKRLTREGLASILDGTSDLRCVGAFDSVERALEGLEESPCEVLLLDIQLPGISGFEVLAALREPHCCGERLPVVAVTASVMDQDRKKILAAGFNAFISKPVNIRELLATLEALLKKAGT